MNPLTPEEFDALSEEEQNRYLELLRDEADEWRLFDKQKRALALAERVDQLLYGGAAGGGKSDLLCFHALELSQRVPRHKSLLIRSSFPELRRTLIQRSLEKFPAGPRWRPSDKEWRFPNGSVIEFGYCETLADARQYLSAEYDFIGIDESSELEPDTIELLCSRLRTTVVKKMRGARPHAIFCTNPGGIGHEWHAENFVYATEFGQHVIDMEIEVDTGVFEPLTRAFVQALPGDNPHLDPNYRRNLAALSDPVKRAQYLHGDWSIFEGQFFSEFRHALHVVPPFQVPTGWERVRGIDWGYVKPFCSLDIAFDPDGRAWVIREVYGTMMLPKEQALRVMVKGERFKVNYADPHVFDATGLGDTIAGQWSRHGLRVVRANNRRAPGWAQVHSYLDMWPDGKPGLQIFSTCPNLVRTLPKMLYSANDPEDLNTKLEDHACDALRYGLQHMPPARRHPAPNDERGKLERLRDQMEQKRIRRQAHKHRRVPSS